MKYNYRENIKNDCVTAINEYLGYEDVKGISKDELREKFYDAFWIDDSVTGNGSGSYTFSTYEAEQNLAGNWELLGKALVEFGCKSNDIEKGAEWSDVIIRCYLLGEAIEEAMEELDEEIEKAINL